MPSVTCSSTAGAPSQVHARDVADAFRSWNHAITRPGERGSAGVAAISVTVEPASSGPGRTTYAECQTPAYKVYKMPNALYMS